MDDLALHVDKIDGIACRRWCKQRVAGPGALRIVGTQANTSTFELVRFAPHCHGLPPLAYSSANSASVSWLRTPPTTGITPKGEWLTTSRAGGSIPSKPNRLRSACDVPNAMPATWAQ